MNPNLAALLKALGRKATLASPIPGFPDSLVAGGMAFVYAATPFNSESAAALCRDKAAAYATLSGVVPMPETRAFIDPRGRHADMAEARSIDDILLKTADMPYPRTVKMNSGERGKHVFFVENDAETRLALERIFDRKSRSYDFIALVQEHIDAKAEWRIAISAGKSVFAYAKGAYAVANASRFAALRKIGDAAARSLSLSWGAVDVLESKEGELFFIEANSRPSYEGYINAHGDDRIAALYRRALSDLSKRGPLHMKNERIRRSSHSIDATASSR